MRARLVRLAEISSRDVDAWRALAARAAEPNPFFEPEFALPLWHHDGLEMELLVVESGTEMVVCLPLRGHERPLWFLPVPIWTVPTALGIPLVDKDHASAALPLAIEFLSRRCGVRRVLFIDRVPTDGLVGPALSSAASDRRILWEDLTWASPVVWRRPTASYLDETLRGGRRRKIGQNRRKLERELGPPMTVVETEARPDTVEKFLAMEAAGRKGRARTAMLCDPNRAAFFREMCRRYSEAGRLRFSSLQGGGTVVAMMCDVVSGRGVYNLKMTYDDRFARFSPGVLLAIEEVRRFHESGYDYMDSCSNHKSSPQFWLYPDARILTRLIVALGGRASRMAIASLASAWRLGRRPRW